MQAPAWVRAAWAFKPCGCLDTLAEVLHQRPAEPSTPSLAQVNGQGVLVLKSMNRMCCLRFSVHLSTSALPGGRSSISLAVNEAPRRTLLVPLETQMAAQRKPSKQSHLMRGARAVWKPLVFWVAMSLKHYSSVCVSGWGWP